MKTINSLKKLSKLFKNKTLSKDDGDVVLLDKGEFFLWTDKEFEFARDVEDIAWEYMESLKINISGV